MKIMYLLRGKPVYCSKCGLELMRTQDNIKHNRHTGVATKVRITYECPTHLHFFWPQRTHCFYQWVEKV